MEGAAVPNRWLIGLVAVTFLLVVGAAWVRGTWAGFEVWVLQIGLDILLTAALVNLFIDIQRKSKRRH